MVIPSKKRIWRCCFQPGRTFHDLVIESVRSHAARTAAALLVVRNLPSETPIARARTWLLSKGWRRHGLLSLEAAPRGAP